MLQKFRQALVLPTLEGWRDTALLLVAFAVTALPLGIYFGFVQRLPLSLTPLQVFRVVIVTLLVPAFIEEFLYRCLLVPKPQSKSFWALGVFSLLLYVASHPLGAWLFRPKARDLFYHPVFLFFIALLGLTCLTAYKRTRSLWSAVIIHWLVVVMWLLWGGFERVRT
jgi:predicted Abi (CAAX) family protease